jgi:hypothetical protein
MDSPVPRHAFTILFKLLITVRLSCRPRALKGHDSSLRHSTLVNIKGSTSVALRRTA